jgi:hypothetical protein
LFSLQGSASLSIISPLEGLWTSLAVCHLSGHDKNEQSVKLEDYAELCRSGFVMERLNDWSSADAGKDESDLYEPIVIYEYEKPIHADYPQILAKEAAEALQQFGEPNTNLRDNPFLPWLAAGSSGYTLPSAAAEIVRSALETHPSRDVAIKEAHKVLRYTGRWADWDERMALISFISSAALNKDG